LAAAAAHPAQPQRRAPGGKVRAGFAGSDRSYGARRAYRDLLAEGIVSGAASDE